MYLFKEDETKTIRKGIVVTRNVALDVLKVVMALMVIGLHAGFLSESTTVP